MSKPGLLTDHLSHGLMGWSGVSLGGSAHRSCLSHDLILGVFERVCL